MSVNRQLTKATVTIQHINATAAGTTNILATTGIDTLGFESVRFVASFGTLSATQVTSLSIFECATLAGSYTLVTNATTNAMADADSNKLLIIENYKPQQRYVKAQVNRGTANAVINAVIAELWIADYQPTTADASVSQQLVLNNSA